MNVSRWLRWLITVVGVGLAVYLVYYAVEYPFSRTKHSVIFFGGSIALYYLVDIHEQYWGSINPDELFEEELTEEGGGRINELSSRFPTAGRFSAPIQSVICVVLAVTSVAATAYLLANWQYLQWDAPALGYKQIDLLVGGVMMILAIDVTRREYGNVLAGVIALSVVYGLFGPFFPGILSHGGMSVTQVIKFGSIELRGVFGFILGVGATWVAIFIIFAGVATQYGLTRFLLDLGEEFSNVFRTGVVHIAIISSMIMGSITGSAAANTATTGSFTIPMMKNQGIKGEVAAAIESVASSGGQILPPVMGVAAFLMADILGIPYLEVVRAGILPALLFYGSTAIAVHLLVIKSGWMADADGEFKLAVLRQGLRFAPAIGVLLYALVIMQLSPLTAGLYTLITAMITQFATNLYTDGVSLSALRKTTRETIIGLRQGMIDMAPLVGLLGAIGIIVSMVTQSGLSQKISVQMIGLAGGTLILVLILAMITSLMFGLGMPTPAAYILVVILTAPPLIELGIKPLSAHMFVFYFAMLSAITPPVAVAVAVGSRIADAGFLKSAFQAFRIGIIGFLLPFVFAYNQSLIYWAFPRTAYMTSMTFIGVFAIAAVAIGHDGNRNLTWPFRIFGAAMAFVIFFGPFTAKVIVSLLLCLYLVQLLRPSSISPIPKWTK
ncbi:TRAP transporter permease [Natrinema caseinilyticum]|uniref:TRAP transporter permease n=1 Tax=Natrinema caseinilyticum TaxID=2961570 RepID=UPI0020C1BBCB|nr:TRAP transporter fused permease subunit [Natrinema caseinilyticum]